jgi:hypothetical protein
VVGATQLVVATKDKHPIIARCTPDLNDLATCLKSRASVPDELERLMRERLTTELNDLLDCGAIEQTVERSGSG